jgi:glutathione S-transferase
VKLDPEVNAVAQYVEVEQAVAMSGLRVVLSPGVPGPWSEAAKGILYVKKLPYVKVRQEIGGENQPLLRWSAQTTAPVFVYEDERPRSLWNDQLYLAERLAPAPPLIPDRLDQRARMFGLANELCGENGLGWSRRLMMLHATLVNPNAPAAAKSGASFLGRKYGYSPEPAEAAPNRIVEILRALNAQLDSQRKSGSKFLVGDRLSALDIYWAAFAALIQPLPDELCRMSPGFRRIYSCTDPAVMAQASQQLLAHRDFVYHEFLELPVDL